MTIAQVLAEILAKITNKVGRIRKADHGAVCTHIVETLDTLKQDINTPVPCTVTPADESAGHANVTGDLILPHVKVFKQGLLVDPSSYTINSPSQGDITFAQGITDGEIIIILY
jgi:hypothetical protein